MCLYCFRLQSACRAAPAVVRADAGDMKADHAGRPGLILPLVKRGPTVGCGENCRTDAVRIHLPRASQADDSQPLSRPSPHPWHRSDVWNGRPSDGQITLLSPSVVAAQPGAALVPPAQGCPAGRPLLRPLSLAQAFVPRASARRAREESWP
ncbi:unnamed protein product [Prorocentrum cordatum]|uniref:Uncharacterized protein n=1 Tax=Prorocentrum cordatum TaxID=2364126 RepID=A0ABN9YEE4_9DINO|nr:unnamed protein product [Polarella glacialis]